MKKQCKTIDRISFSDCNQAVIDEMGYHFPMQVVIFCNGRFSIDALNKLNSAFAETTLGKLKKKSYVPFARDHWIPLPSDKIPPVFTTSYLISEDQIHAWLDSQIDGQYQVTQRAGWKISAVNLIDNRYVISIVLLHQLIDAHGAYDIVRQLSSGQIQPLPAEKDTSLRADISDACHNFTRLLSLTIVEKISRAIIFARSLTGNSLVLVDPWKTLLFDLDHIEQKAQELGGSVTSLGIALTANVANAILNKNNNEYILTPVKGEDKRSNSVRTALINLSTLPSPINSLAEIKPLAKIGYAQSSALFNFFNLKKIYSFYSNAGVIPNELIDIFPDMITAFAKASIWNKNDRFLPLIKSTMSFSTIYQNTFALSFISIAQLTSDQLMARIQPELDRFNLTPYQVL